MFMILSFKIKHKTVSYILSFEQLNGAIKVNELCDES